MRRLGRQRTEAELDRLLAGKNLPAENGPSELADFVQALKGALSAEPRPEVQASHLSAIMQEVKSQLENGGSLALGPAPGTAASRPSGWRKAVLRGAGVSMALKIVGGAVALAGTTGGLAALDALPEPAQAPVATAVEAVTPFELPGNPEEKAREEIPKLKIEEVPPVQLPPAANPNAEFGQKVSEDARDAGVSGPEISSEAKHEAEQRREEGRSHRPPEVVPGSPGHVPGPPPGAGPPPGKGPTGGGPQNGLDNAGRGPAGPPVPQSVPAGPPASAGR